MSNKHSGILRPRQLHEPAHESQFSSGAPKDSVQINFRLLTTEAVDFKESCSQTRPVLRRCNWLF